MAEFEKLITPRTKAIVICNPNNPTGYLYSREEMDTLRDIVIRHGLYLFSDEAYRDFCYSGEHISAMNLKGAEDNVLMMDTISKRYSACGGRIGALVTRNQQVLDTVMKFAQARLSPPSFAQILGEAACDLPVDYFNATKAEYLKRRDVLVGRLNRIPGVFCPNPGGAFYAMASLPVDDTDVFCQWLLESFAYKNQTVMLAPAGGVLWDRRVWEERGAACICVEYGGSGEGDGLFGEGVGGVSGDQPVRRVSKTYNQGQCANDFEFG